MKINCSCKYNFKQTNFRHKKKHNGQFYYESKNQGFLYPLTFSDRRLQI